MLVATLLVCETALADWPADGVPLCSSCVALGSIVAADATGGAYVAWTDYRNSPAGTNPDVYMQHVTATGTIAPGWPSDGVAVSLAPSYQLAEFIAPDLLGGAIVAWRDFRDAANGTGGDIYAQRVLADGTLAPGWPVDGAPVARTPINQSLPVVLPDGNGGAFVTWDEGDGPDPNIFLQHMAPDGGVMPGWPSNGISVCTVSGNQGTPQLASDGTGGVFVGWGDYAATSATHAQRITAAGEVAAGWPANGLRFMLGPYQVQLISDGAGGAYVLGAVPAFYFGDCYVQRLTGAGDVSPGWPANGAPVCLAPDDERAGLRMEPDGAGGALMAWSDVRDHTDSDVYALRMRPDGTRYPGWTEDGVAVTVGTALDDFVDLAPDGQGGAYLTWDRYTTATQDQVMIQHLTGSGNVAPGWPAGGREVPNVVGSNRPRIAADGMGGAIVVWESYAQSRALRIAPDGPVAVQVSLASADAEADVVRLIWYALHAASLLATVERHTSSDDWQQLARISPDGTGRIQYEDRAVTPGTRYAYRLAYSDGDALAHTTETWVEVPALAFALRGLTPNPSVGDPIVVFTLPNGGAATLELFDLAGRQVIALEVGSFGTGTHRVSLASAGHLVPGVYSLRLTQGGRRATTRAVVMR